jgi:O-antigen/teichoic acid export membrane protein
LENPYKKFARDVFIIGIANALLALSGIIFMPLITKILGAYDYGIWTQVQVTISMVIGFVSLGLPYALTRFLPAKADRGEIQEEFYSSFCLIFIVTLVVSIIIIAAAQFIAGALFDGATTVVQITGLIILVQSLDQVFLTLFRAFRQMKRYAIFTVANTYVQVGLIAYLVLNGHGILSIVLAFLAIKAVMFFILFYLIKSQIGIKRPRFSKIREYLSFGLPTIPGNIAAWVVSSSDRYVIGYFLGATSIGIYSAGYTLGSLIMMPAGILAFVLPPTLSKLYDEGRMTEVKTHLSYSLKYLLAVAIPFVFGAFVLAQPVLRLFTTAEIATHGYFVVPLVALGTLFFAGSVPISLILTLAKKTKITGAIWIICGLVNLGLNILVVPRWGIVGATVTTLIAYGLRLGLSAYYSFKEFKFPIDWRFIMKSLIASGAMATAIWVIAPEGTSATILTVIAGTGIYGAIIYLLKGFNKGEFKFFRELFQRD